MTAVSVSPAARRGQLAWMVAALLLAAFNLRPAITSVAAVLQSVSGGLALTSAAEGWLTMLPVLCLGVAAPLAPWLTRRWGSERVMPALLGVLVLALLLRPYLGAAGLFLGTVVAGATLGVLGVLLPALVKRDFPERVTLMTGIYTAALSLGAAIAAGATEPLRLLFADSWRFSLAFWLLPAALAALAWLGHNRRHAPARNGASARSFGPLLRDPLAWQVTFFMGLQSSLAYIVFGWLPTILTERGLSPVAAGLALSVCIVLQIIANVGAPWVDSRMADQRGGIALFLALTTLGFAGCLYAPLSLLWVSIACLGLGLGGMFALALALLALRAPDTHTAGQLSAMAQGFGYIVASLGPLATGLIHDATGNWQSTGPLVGLIALGALIAALGAGRKRLVGRRSAPGA